MSLSTTTERDKSQLHVFVYSVDNILWDEFTLHIEGRPNAEKLRDTAEERFQEKMGQAFYIDLLHNSVSQPTNKKLTNAHLDSAVWWEDAWNEEIGMYALHAKLRPIKSQL
ncbi:hypothetical protein GGI24_002665 [Coemansia furcata]|nr:hypothetical protein GGI24_002665 [Coemansia furcata]